jgi:hypothetical protein
MKMRWSSIDDQKWKMTIPIRDLESSFRSKLRRLTALRLSLTPQSNPVHSLFERGNERTTVMRSCQILSKEKHGATPKRLDPRDTVQSGLIIVMEDERTFVTDDGWT